MFFFPRYLIFCTDFFSKILLLHKCFFRSKCWFPIEIILFEANCRSTYSLCVPGWKHFVSQGFPNWLLCLRVDTLVSEFESKRLLWSERRTIVIWMRLFGVGCSYMLHNRRLNAMLAKRPVAATSTTTIYYYCYCCCCCSFALIVFLALFLSHFFPIIRTRVEATHACTHAIPHQRSYHLSV